MRRIAGTTGLLVWLLTLVGCGKTETPQQKKVTPSVQFAYPVTKRVFDFELFTGKTEASTKVDLRARVTGYLERTFFTEGTIVEKDATLFLIDQRSYKVALASAQASLASAQASVVLATSLESRGRGLVGQGAFSREDLDKLIADLKVGRANVQGAEAMIEQAKLNLQWTEVKAPFRGRVSRWNVDPGNLVKADDTILVTLVAVEPMFVTFDVDERTVLKQLVRAGLTQMPPKAPLRVDVGLVDEPGEFPHPATINFVDTRLDSATGSLWMRAELIAPDRPVQPGMFSRVRFPLNEPADALCVSESALVQSQGKRSLFVVDESNKVKELKNLTFGRQHGALRVVKDGLKETDRVVVTGLQRIKDGLDVIPQKLENGMPGQKTGTASDEPKDK